MTSSTKFHLSVTICTTFLIFLTIFLSYYNCEVAANVNYQPRPNTKSTNIRISGNGMDSKFDQQVFTTKRDKSSQTLVDFFTGGWNSVEDFLEDLDPADPFDINKQDPTTGNTLLHLAVIEKSRSAVKQLLLRLPDVSIQNKEGLTPHQLAVHLHPNDKRLIDMLRKAAVKPSGQNCTLIAPPQKLGLENSCKGAASKTFSALRKGESLVGNINRHKDVVLVLGNTGSGKSTVVNFLFGDDTTLHAVRASPSSPDIIVMDDHDKIGYASGSSASPHTKLPEMLRDNETEVVFFDCPGFAEDISKCSSYEDIAAPFLLKKVLDRVEGVKLLFVIDHQDLVKGKSKSGVPLFLKYVTQLIKPIKKFNNSFTTIVTKAPLFRPATRDSITNAELVQETADFLQGVRDNLAGNLISNAENSTTNKKLELLDMMLEKKAETGLYSKIIVLQTANVCGPISSLKLWQDVKASMRQRILHGIQFAKVEGEGDFGYSISHKTNTTLVEKLYVDIVKRISSIVKSVFKYFEVQVLQRSDVYKDIDKAAKVMRKFHKVASDFVKKFGNSSFNLNEIVSSLLQMGEELEFLVLENEMRNISWHAELSNFLSLVSNQTVNTLDLRLKGLDEIFGDISVIKNWYEFINSLYDYTISYGIQKNSVTFREELKSFYSNLDSQNLSWGNSSFFVNHFESVPGFMDIRKTVVALDGQKRAELKRVLEFSFSPLEVCAIPSESNKGGSLLKIRGNLVKLSEIKNLVTPNTTGLQVLASHTIFIDDDILVAGADVVVLAPVWQVMGPYSISTQGGAGVALVPGKASGYISTKEWMPGFSSPWKFGSRCGAQKTRKDGRAGLSGLPGEYSGTFFGYGLEYNNIHRLTVNVKGGSGGKGQDGGDGRDGVNGKPAVWKRWEGKSWTTVPWYIMNGYSYKHPFCYNFDKVISTSTSKNDFFNVFLFGETRTPPGNGGDAGAGGFGGYSGEIFFSKSSNTSINVISGVGDLGVNGIGGMSGNCSRDGSFYHLEMQISRVFSNMGREKAPLGEMRKFRYELEKPSSSPLYPPCTHGSAGKNINFEDRAPPPRRKLPPKLLFSKAVTDFKVYMAQKSSTIGKSGMQVGAVNDLAGDIVASGFFGNKEFIQEFLELEQLDPHIHKQFLLGGYHGMLKRMREMDGEEVTDIIRYLYLAVNFQLGVLERSKLQMADLERLISAMPGENSLGNHTNLYYCETVKEFGDKIHPTINELVETCKVHLLPSVDRVESQLLHRIELAAATGETSSIELDKLEQQQQEMRVAHQTVEMSIFSVFKFVASFLNNSVLTLASELETELSSKGRRHTQKCHELLGIKSTFTSSGTPEETEVDNDDNEIYKVCTTAITQLDKYGEMVDGKLRVLNSDTKSPAEDLGIADEDNLIQKIKNLEKFLYANDKHWIDTIRLKIVAIQRHSIGDGSSTTLFCTGVTNLAPDLLEIQKHLRLTASHLRTNEDGKILINLVDQTLKKGVDIFINLETFRTEKQLTDLFSLFMSQELDDIDEDDKIIQELVGNVKIAVLGHAIVRQYSVALYNFNQRVFPFAHNFSDVLPLKGNLYHSNVSAPDTLLLESLKTTVVNKMEIMASYLNSSHRQKKTNDDDDEPFAPLQEYSSRLETLEPFFIWRWDTWKNSIARILSGIPVMLKADHNPSYKYHLQLGGKQNVMFDFQDVRVNFRGVNNSVTSRLSKSLENFYVNISHSGDSYYKCDNEVYEISEVPVTKMMRLGNHGNLSASRPDDGIEDEVGLVYGPYGFWTFTIFSMDEIKGQEAVIDNLGKYERVDLELVGTGKYLREGVLDFSRLHLPKYYTRVEVGEGHNKISIAQKVPFGIYF